MATQKKIPIGCQIDRGDYDWLQSVKHHLQRSSVGNVSMASVIKDIIRKAKEEKVYGDIQEG